MVSHEEVDTQRFPHLEGTYRILRPRKIPFVSYPYEWCFGQLRDAALLTLDIQECALKRGMSLKDGSAFNIQFMNGHPILVDTLSFERWNGDQPWPAYGQFCRHFLAPLALAAHSDPRALLLWRAFADGIPLDQASRFLPKWTRILPGLGLHIHAHARYIKRGSSDAATRLDRPLAFRKSSLRGLIDHLRSTVASLRIDATSSPWSAYRTRDSYSERGRGLKRQWVDSTLATLGPGRLWDLGANTGDYSFSAADAGWEVVALDGDHGAVELCYRRQREVGATRILPLVMDLMNPSGGAGWLCEERHSLLERGPADLVLALALVHHLAIGNNVPLSFVARFLRRCATSAIVEFVPKDDPQVQQMIALKGDLFPSYSQEHFEEAASAHFSIRERRPVPDGGRVLYLLGERSDP
jgi:ribosomal protein L11 methylase PrmA